MDQMAELSIHSILYLFFQYWDPIPNDKDPSFKFSVIVIWIAKVSRIKYGKHKSCSVANYSDWIAIWQHCNSKIEVLLCQTPRHLPSDYSVTVNRFLPSISVIVRVPNRIKAGHEKWPWSEPKAFVFVPNIWRWFGCFWFTFL